MAKITSERGIPRNGLMAFDFNSGAEIEAFIVKNRLDDSYRKFYYQNGLTLIIWADSTNELLEMYHQLKDYIMFDSWLARGVKGALHVRDHYKLMPIPALAA